MGTLIGMVLVYLVAPISAIFGVDCRKWVSGCRRHNHLALDGDRLFPDGALVSGFRRCGRGVASDRTSLQPHDPRLSSPPLAG